MDDFSWVSASYSLRKMLTIVAIIATLMCLTSIIGKLENIVNKGVLFLKKFHDM